jgi:mannose-binding lectin 2
MPLSVPNWQVEFEFKIDGEAHNIYGDGFALWISKDRARLGPVFGSIGTLYETSCWRVSADF